MLDDDDVMPAAPCHAFATIVDDVATSYATRYAVL